jgi:hypothetical protein
MNQIGIFLLKDNVTQIPLAGRTNHLSPPGQFFLHAARPDTKHNIIYYQNIIIYNNISYPGIFTKMISFYFFMQPFALNLYTPNLSICKGGVLI